MLSSILVLICGLCAVYPSEATRHRHTQRRCARCDDDTPLMLYSSTEIMSFMYEMFNRLGLHFIHLVSLIRFALSIKCTAWLSKREYFVLWTMHAMRMVSRFFGSVIGRLHSKDYQCSLAITWNLRIFSWDRSTLSRGSKSLIVPLAFNENSIIVVLM